MKRGVMLLLILGMMTGTSRADYLEFTGPTAHADFLAATTGSVGNFWMEPVIDFEGDHGGIDRMPSYTVRLRFRVISSRATATAHRSWRSRYRTAPRR